MCVKFRHYSRLRGREILVFKQRDGEVSSIISSVVVSGSEGSYAAFGGEKASVEVGCLSWSPGRPRISGNVKAVGQEKGPSSTG